MIRLPRMFAVSLVAILIAFGCRQPMGPASPDATTTPAPPKPAPRSVTDTQAPVLAEARKEGVVTIYSLWKPEVRIALTQAFREKTGISLEVVPFSRGEDMAARAQQEKAAGIVAVDVFGAGASSFISVMKPAGILGPMEPVLFPGVETESKVWIGGNFPYTDRDKRIIPMTLVVNRDIMYNSTLVKKDQITSFKDLLKPEFKEKISVDDPAMTGAGAATFSLLANKIWNLEEAKDFLRLLLKQQKATIQRNNRLHFEGVAHGKYLVGIGNNHAALSEFIAAGAPIDIVYTKEGVSGNPSSGTIAVPSRFAHPNAARVFVNWLVSREGHTVFSRSFGAASLRSDVSAEGINPRFLVQPGEKLFMQDEEEIISRPRLRSIFKEIVDASN